MWWPFQSQYATEVLIEILRLISSGSKSVVVEPSSTAAEARDRACREQHGFDEGCFTDATVTDDADVPDLPDLDRHQLASLERAMRWGDATTEGRSLLSPDRTPYLGQNFVLGAGQIGRRSQRQAGRT